MILKKEYTRHEEMETSAQSSNFGSTRPNHCNYEIFLSALLEDESTQFHVEIGALENPHELAVESNSNEAV